MAERLSADIVERALAGDAAALRRMVDTYQDDMLNLAFRVTGDAEASWEIVRDVFLRLLEHPGSVAGREGIIEEPLLHGVWALARQTDVRHDQLPRGDRAVEAVAGAAMLLPDRSRCALALGDLLKVGIPGIAAVLGITDGAAAELLTRSRLLLADGLGVRGRDQALVEAEAARVYGLWPAEAGDPMAPEIIEEAEQRGLLGPVGATGPVIGGVRITPAMGLAILLVPLLIAAAIAMAVRSGGGDDSDPVTPATTDLVTESFTDAFTGTDGATTGTTTNVISTVSPGDSVTDSDGSSGSDDGTSGSGGSDTPAVEPEPAPEPEPEPTTASEPEPTPTVTRAPGSGAPPPPTTTQAAPAPATTTSGGAQPPPPELP